MPIVLIDKLLNDFISSDEVCAISESIKNAHVEIKKRYEKNVLLSSEMNALNEGIKNTSSEDNIIENILDRKTTLEKLKKEFTPLGWWKLPVNYDKDEYLRIKVTAKKIQILCDIFIVLGIGGSYLGTRAAIDFIKSPNYNAMSKDTPDIYFTGNSISSAAIKELVDLCQGRDVCINVISKSGETTETALAFRIFRKLLEDKYGKDEARKRIFVTTGSDSEKTLKRVSIENKYETFTVPHDIGGRYSVLTSVGLLPIAVAGIDIDKILDGACQAMHDLSDDNIKTNPCIRYAALRNILYNKGKSIEIFACYDPALTIFGEWWKQLFGESEGKDNRGLFPASVTYSTDLHSLGQIIQQGKRIMFETVVSIKKPQSDLVIDFEDNAIDGMNYLAGKTIDSINKTAMLATAVAHTDGGVPNMIIEIIDRSAASFGYMVYFFELACAISGYVLGINPFDQPGVENYKDNMYGLLGKPDKPQSDKYSKIRTELENRLMGMNLNTSKGTTNIYNYFLGGD